MKISLVFLAAALCVLPSSSVLAHGPHEHGLAGMNLVVEGSLLSITLESPLANFLAFEHAPETEQQKEEARALAARLREAAGLFRPDAAAGCRPEGVVLESEALKDILREFDPESAALQGDGEADGGEHGDLDAEYSFRCRKPEELRSVEVLLFSVWPGLREIEVRMVTPAGQGAAELTPEQTMVRW